MDGRGKPQHLERTTVEVIQGYRCWIHMYVRVSYRKRCDDRGRKKRYIYYRQWWKEAMMATESKNRGLIRLWRSRSCAGKISTWSPLIRGDFGFARFDLAWAGESVLRWQDATRRNDSGLLRGRRDATRRAERGWRGEPRENLTCVRNARLHLSRRDAHQFKASFTPCSLSFPRSSSNSSRRNVGEEGDKLYFLLLFLFFFFFYERKIKF